MEPEKPTVGGYNERFKLFLGELENFKRFIQSYEDDDDSISDVKTSFNQEVWALITQLQHPKGKNLIFQERTLQTVNVNLSNILEKVTNLSQTRPKIFQMVSELEYLSSIVGKLVSDFEKLFNV